MARVPGASMSVDVQNRVKRLMAEYPGKWIGDCYEGDDSHGNHVQICEKDDGTGVTVQFS